LFRVLNLRRFSLLLLLFSAIAFCTVQSYANNFLYSEAQILPHQSSFQPPGVKITSHVTGQKVPTGELTISGTSTDNPNTECQVYTDLNDIKPMQKVKATGLGGNNDYSEWTYTYNSAYRLVQNGTNNLTSKISCIDTASSNLTKWNSVNVTGVDGLAGLSQPSITNVVGNTTNSTDTVISQSLAQTPFPLITPPLQPTDIVDNSNDDNQGQNNEEEDEEDNDEDDRTVRPDTEEDEDEDEDDSTQVSNSQDEDEADNNDDEDTSDDDDGDGCGIGDEGFPFCDGRPGEDDSNGSDDGDDCGIGDEGFPFC
jgi:hypothetical protein